MYPELFSAAAEVDRTFLIILGFCVAILVLVTTLMLLFVWRYNYKRHPRRITSYNVCYTKLLRSASAKRESP